ncbi:hypothetical protein ScalyP_jg2691, partial [Parmales sp. scaly parma]
KWFSSRVKRYVPEPKILYERVRAVYAAFGDRKDSTKADSKPLFTKTAWKKAKKNLNNIKKGYVSDPPPRRQPVLSQTQQQGRDRFRQARSLALPLQPRHQ